MLNVESASKRKVWAIAALSACTLGVASVMSTAPSSIQAADLGMSRYSGLVAGVHPAYTGGQVVQTFPGQWDLKIGIRWQCAMDYNGVDQAIGLIRLWSPTSPDLAIDLPCTLNASVGPGQPVLQNVVIPWDERSEVHQWLRQGNPEDVRSAFHVEWASGATPPEKDTSHFEPIAAGRRNTHGLRTGQMSMSPR
jgi:hypothetical protein